MKFIIILLAVICAVPCFSSVVENRGKRSYGRCGENEVFSQCFQNCNPTCEDQHPYCVQDCSRQGCQCAAGYVRQGGRCVHITSCGASMSMPCRFNYQCQVGSVCSASGTCRREVVSQYQQTVRTSSSSRTYGSYSALHQTCRLDNDCPNLQICLNRICTLTDSTRRTSYVSSGGMCRVHNDCGRGNVCVDRMCKPDSFMGVNEHVQSGTTLCRTNNDCFGGKSCLGNICKFI